MAAGVLAERCLAETCSRRRGRGAGPRARAGLLAAGDALLGPGASPALVLAALDAGLLSQLWDAVAAPLLVDRGGESAGEAAQLLAEARDSALGWQRTLDGHLRDGSGGGSGSGGGGLDEREARRVEVALGEVEDMLVKAEAALRGRPAGGGAAAAPHPAPPRTHAEEAALFQAALREELSGLHAAVAILEVEAGAGPGGAAASRSPVTSEAAADAAIRCQAAYPTVRGVIRERLSDVGRSSIKEAVSPQLLSELVALQDRLGGALRAFGRVHGGVWAEPPPPAEACGGDASRPRPAPGCERVARASSEIGAFLSVADLPAPAAPSSLDGKLLLRHRRDLEVLKSEGSELRREVEELQRAFHETLAGLEGELFATLREANQIRGRWLEEIEERKRLHESLQILKGNVRVRCRIRPLEASEEGPVVYLAGSYFGDRENVLVTREATLPIGAPGYRGKHLGAGRQGSRGEQSFRFDNVFGPEATNAEVYGDVAELVVSALEGYNVCIFAYGQTGSGKTHSIIGPAGDPGIVVRATSDLFRAAGERREHGFEYELSVSVKEIYQDKVFDLLSEDVPQLDVKLDPESGMPCAPGEVIAEVRSAQETIDMLLRAARRRSTAQTIMNACSSRSHLLTTVLIRCTDPKTGRETLSKLHMVDLAGSERISKSGAAGARKEEAIKINVSLLALSEVMSALGSKKGHVPYRRSKLTFLLQDSLSGSAKTVMLVNLSPSASCREETLCSLNFAQRVARVELGRATQQVTGGSSSGPAGTRGPP